MATEVHLGRVIRRVKFLRGLLLLLFIGAVGFAINVVHDLDQGVRSLRTAEQNDPVWVASHLQAELLQLKSDLSQFALGYGSANDVALRFDIAWSRINVLQEGKLSQIIGSFPVDASILAELEAEFQSLEPAIKRLNSNNINEEVGRSIAEDLVLSLNGFNGSIKDFLVSLAQATTKAETEFRAELLSYSHTVVYLSLTILCLLGIFILELVIELRASRKTESEMSILATEAQSAARMKMNFMSVISHELRTPLTSIIGGLTLLKRRLDGTMKDATAHKLLDVASRNGDRLLALVNDILDAQALSEGKVSVQRVPEDLNRIVISAVEGCHSYAEQLGVRYQLSTPNEEMVVLTDSARVNQIVVNLISNAAKFTSAGDVVEICLKRDGQTARIEVTDHGIGIPADRQSAIFTPFHQINPGTTGDNKSSGLGLSITKQLIDLLDGDIGFNSVEGRGSTFWIELNLLSEFSPRVETQYRPAPVSAAT
ncbi:sensor histidine kinase [Sulfitobacter delicatus]|uniref:histidine kinase n=1 Tax=Sulfitobacter delicatus TaxID=218672 RepID=A0A1G7Z6B3_9RHOB|nr:HAMP domain-containing sensor histidine kinase [Sulfitobacter delicatus]SDH04292.1 His Kinase A (phospho-acceptor) domain-containing protein [Sulfitobacter delicatus]